MRRESARRPTALVVDDNVANRRLLELTLGLDGFDLTMAATVAEAEEALKAARPDVALVDLSLPDRHGTDLVRWIRSEPAWADLPVIAVSACALEHDIAGAMAAGCDHFLAKPIDTRTFGDEVRTVIGRHRGEESVA